MHAWMPPTPEDKNLRFYVNNAPWATIYLAFYSENLEMKGVYIIFLDFPQNMGFRYLLHVITASVRRL